MMLLRKFRVLMDIQIWLFAAGGWFLAGKFQSLYEITEKNSLEKCPQCPERDCMSCENADFDLNNQKIRNLQVANSYYRQYPFKPLNVNEDMLSRWKVMSNKHQYEMISGEPRIGLNGMWRLELKDVDNFVVEKITEDSKNLPFNVKNVKLHEVFRKTDPFSGTTYIAKIHYDKSFDGQLDKPTAAMIQLQKSFISGKPKLLSITTKSKAKMIHIISTISSVSDRFERYLRRMSTTIYMTSNITPPIKLNFVFVIFLSDDRKTNEKITSVISKFQETNPSVIIESVIISDVQFNRALGIDKGTKLCKDDDLMLFMDVDIDFGYEFLQRVLLNTLQRQTVFFPIVFSQYDPDIVNLVADKSGIKQSQVKNKSNIDEQTGFWLHYAFGIMSVYKSDYVVVGGFKLEITGWGGEDVDLYEKFIKYKGINVMSAVDPDLAHVYHPRGCDKNLAKDQYVMCIGAWSDTLASQREAAAIYLDTLQ